MLLSTINPWAVVAWMIAGTWIGLMAVFVRAYWQQKPLSPECKRSESEDLTSLSVIVAARNEAACIETCIRSLFRQDYPGLEVVAVNDRSADRTGEILDALAIEFGERLKVIHVSSLPAGWFGKPHALTLGFKRSIGRLVCFTDADCEFQVRTALRAAVEQMADRQLDLFSVTARYTMTTLRESVVVPCCSELLMTWLRPERCEDPLWPDAFANGAFIMAHRGPFEQIGGWEAVRTQISEDLQLARLAKRSNFRVGVGSGEGFYQTGSYATIRDSWNGWSRIFKGALNPVQLLITIGRMFVLFVLPMCAVLSGLLDAAGSGNFEWFTSAAGLGFTIAFCLRCSLDMATFRLVGAPLYAVPLAPLGRAFVMAAATRALFSHAGLVNTYWRGAAFCSGQLVMPRPVSPKTQIQ